MEQGITVDLFVGFSQKMHESCEKIRDLKENNEPGNTVKIENEILILLNYASDLLEYSNGFIQTDNEDVINLFKSVFNMSGSIKIGSQNISHYHNQITKALNNYDYDKVIENTRNLSFEKHRLDSCLEKLEIETEKAMNLGNYSK